jgi:hypothetical protein
MDSIKTGLEKKIDHYLNDSASKIKRKIVR